MSDGELVKCWERTPRLIIERLLKFVLRAYSQGAAKAAKAREADLKSQKEVSYAIDLMFEAGAAAPRDRDDLSDSLRDVTF
jgi:hypothetical protein